MSLHRKRSGRCNTQIAASPFTTCRGFSLLEVLVVIVIMSLLLTLAGTALFKSGSRASTGADQLASAVRLAASAAKSKNRIVWLRMGPDEENPQDLELRFFRSSDGTNDASSVREYRRAIRIEQVRLQGELPEFGDRPEVPGDDRLRERGALVFLPSGESFLVPEADGFPMPEGTLSRIWEIGLRGVRGRSGHLIENDQAAIHISGLSADSTIHLP